MQKLHDILQIVMGWTDSHLHMFEIGETRYSVPDWDDWGEMNYRDEADYTLDQLFEHEGQGFRYEYDFGDSWWHTLTIEKIISEEGGVRYPVCVDGRRACPPEDVGGTGGYEEFLEVLADPEHEDHEHYTIWAGGRFDSEEFDLETVNQKLRAMGQGQSEYRKSDWPIFDEYLEMEIADQMTKAPKTFSPEVKDLSENLALRKDIVSMLRYLEENKVTGTQSTGNFPLKAVREISSQFVDPPAMEERIGNHVYKVRSESEVRPLFFRHMLAASGGLISGGLGRRWKLTALGEQFLAGEPAWQVWFLSAAWWKQTNWIIVSQYDFEDNYFPYWASGTVLETFLSLSPGEEQAFESLGDRIVKDLGLASSREDEESTRRFLRNIVKYMVIVPLIEFKIIEPVYRGEKEPPFIFPELVEVKITATGREILEATQLAL